METAEGCVPDADLVARTMRGDEAAFGMIIDRYFPLVMGIAYHKVRDTEDARDIAQETFIKAHRSLHSLDDPARFAPWLKRIANNLCIDSLRRRRHNVVSLNELEETHAVARTEADAPEMMDKNSTSSRTMLQILDSIESLPESAREAVELRFIESLSYEEIAVRLEVSTGAVRQRVSRGTRLLREKLDGMDWNTV